MTLLRPGLCFQWNESLEVTFILISNGYAAQADEKGGLQFGVK
jgi:hypothetical protein